MGTLDFKRIEIDSQSLDKLITSDSELLGKLDDELIKISATIKIDFVESEQKFKISLNVNQQNIEIVCQKLEWLFLNGIVTIGGKTFDQNWIGYLENYNSISITVYHKEGQTLSYELKISENLKSVIDVNYLKTILFGGTGEIDQFVNKINYEIDQFVDKSNYEKHQLLIVDRGLLEQLKMNKIKLLFISSNDYERSQLFYKTNDDKIIIDAHQINTLYRLDFFITDKLLRNGNQEEKEVNIFFNKNYLVLNTGIQLRKGFGYYHIGANSILYYNIVNFKTAFTTVNFVLSDKILINNLKTNDNLQLIFDPECFAEFINYDTYLKFSKALVDYKESLGILKAIVFTKHPYYEKQRFEFKKGPVLVVSSSNVSVNLGTILMKYIQLFDYINLDSDDFYQGFFKYGQTKPVLNKIMLNEHQQIKCCFINDKKEVEINFKDIIARNSLAGNYKEKILCLIDDMCALLLKEENDR